MTSCDAMVFFGASGDLAYKKVLPALYRLVDRHRLRVPIIGVAKSDWDTQRLIQHARASLDASRESVDAEAFDRLAALLCYVQGDYTDPGTFERLHGQLESAARPLFYMAIPPALFDDVVRGLHESGCSRDGRLLIEKPFGHDLESARELNRVIHGIQLAALPRMTTTILTIAPDALEILIDGRLNKSDYERFVPLAEKRIAQHGSINLLIHVQNLTGWSPEALWEDLKFDAKHYSHVRRIALVAETETKRWLSTLSKPFTKAEVKFFTKDGLEKARQWVREASAPEATLPGTG